MLKISPHVVLTRTEDAAVLLDKKSGTYFRINPMGTAVFEMLAAGRTQDEVVSELSARHPAAADRIPGDVAKLIDTMRRAKVLV
ncbi:MULTISPECIES: lasso peptide biosynthesis PqqD family chaperone [unclassified Streptomyces]|uniref:Lasso peptide biosynthesis PqqD family chaperone n=1 Tax=Streptomyces sp. R33 TaxID=3238629 RepID=A0AB39XWG6_9ACTN|nr:MULTISPECIES: lasso peptide biosynthesis PqqD family chaperone [unclassified Streptomyces]TDU73938.1 coenzyme PQQ synthesis protein D (PqqD) [Streptomyces sp. KS 21]THA32795.1 lasso peptide biosynthesis PqqD family chaperone [Streptomyces sp. A1547]